MKTVDAGYLAHLATRQLTLAKCAKVTRTDGGIYGFTDHDRDLVVSGVTYAALSGFLFGAQQLKADYSVPNMEMVGAFDSVAVTEADLEAGLWNGAVIEVFRVNWADVTQGIEKLGKGYLGDVKRGRTGFTAEWNGLLKHFLQQIGDLFSPDCRAELGDARCKVRLDPPAWAATTAYTVRPAGDAGLGSVVKPSAYNNRHFKCTTGGTSGGSEPSWDTVIGNTTADGSVVWTAIQALTVEGSLTSDAADRMTLVDTSRTEADDTFGGGTITFISGLNIGLSQQVKSWTLSGTTMVLQKPMPYACAASDDYTMTVGCRFRHDLDCVTRFDNIHNFRGEPHVPGTQHLLSGGL
ncbi:MAG TPA: DUF2163 domain-containing protein [Burkholderiales bacterium]|nr:DUF2163 domain-containing protein [Burkholderiales bacterium]